MTDIFFTSPEHRTRWLTAVLTIQKTWKGKLDAEYASALYILTCSSGTWQKVESYVSRDGIDFEPMLAEVDFSGGYGVLIRLAGNLFNDRTTSSPVDLMRLDDTNFQVALTALQIRRVSLPLDELASKAELYNIELDIRNAISRANRPKPWLPLHDGE
jgi:Family of unknown function (DUF6075)